MKISKNNNLNVTLFKQNNIQLNNDYLLYTRFT